MSEIDDWPDMADDYESDEPDEDYPWEDSANCGSRRKHQCDLAGTEYCDWSCPLHNEVFPPRKRRA